MTAPNQSKVFWIGYQPSHYHDRPIVKKMTAEQLEDFYNFDYYGRCHSSHRLDYLRGLRADESDRKAIRRIILRGTDGVRPYQMNKYGAQSGGYAVSFVSAAAARKRAAEMFATVDAWREEAEKKAAEERKQDAKYLEKYFTNKSKLNVATWMAGRYDEGDKYTNSVKIAEVAKAEAALVMDDDDAIMKIDMDLEDAIRDLVYEKKSLVKRLARLKKGSVSLIVTEEGIHAFSTSMAAAKRAVEKQRLRELDGGCDW